VLLLWIGASWAIQAIRLWPLRQQARTASEGPKKTAREDAA